MKKRTILIIIFLLTGGLVLWGINKGETKQMTYTKSKNTDVLSMMLQNEDGSYEETTRSEWPTEEYTLNTSLSFCENGGTISWDDDKKIVVMDSDASDKCYVYFDLSNSKNFAEYIKSLYTGVQGENNLYLHDSLLANGANDGSYRFAGSSETTNNFVCFGYDSTDGSCPTDNLYRIIGVFGDNVKLIKYDYATSDLLGVDGDYSNRSLLSSNYDTYKGNVNEVSLYYWNSATADSWADSSLNSINLNIDFLRNIGTTWANKMLMSTWKVGGNTWDDIAKQSVATTYKNELLLPSVSTTVSKKVGLMYISDYGYAAAPRAWNTFLNDYHYVISINWMYMGLPEWTITPLKDNSKNEFAIRESGLVGNAGSNSTALPLSLCFYLNSDIIYKSGNGTMSTPYIIE